MELPAKEKKYRLIMTTEERKHLWNLSTVMDDGFTQLEAAGINVTFDIDHIEIIGTVLDQIPRDENGNWL